MSSVIIPASSAHSVQTGVIGQRDHHGVVSGDVVDYQTPRRAAHLNVSDASSGFVRFMKSLPAIPAGRKPWMGFALGCLFGPFGVGIYLRSWLDFFLIIAGVIVATVLVIRGEAYTVGNLVPILWGLWAMMRIKHGRTTSATRG